MENENFILRNGTIVDGTNKPRFIGDVLVQNHRIQLVKEGTKVSDAKSIDCNNKIICPGFIDVHSHMDYFAISNQKENFDPFISQGITTMVVGNCGFSPFGFKKNTIHLPLIEKSLFKEGHGSIHWHDFNGYKKRIDSYGTPVNLLNLVGHGVCRTSFNGFSPVELNQSDLEEMLLLLEDALDQGAAGVSLGLQYKPGVFSSMDELRQVARLVKRKGKILTVHAKSYSVLSGTYPMNPFGTPHNLLAIDDLISLAKDTGVSLQISHLLFAGEKTWPTTEEALNRISIACDKGIDVKFDIFPNCFGATLLNTLLPEWVMAGMPKILENRLAMMRLQLEANLAFHLVGIGFNDIQISNASCAEYHEYNGKSIGEIARLTSKSPFRILVEILKFSNAEARMILHKYYHENLIPLLMKHPASLFMTDAWPEPSGVQNASAYGAFPKFLSIARDTKCLSLEETIYKMTGLAANRFKLKKRGIIADGYFADLVVFDWDKIQDNTSPENSDATPSGIDHVFINGKPCLLNSKLTNQMPSGEFITS
ncbi:MULTISPECIES: N-acyl-D-amino-acid deacylase family protein [Leptospira]|uniref:Amidohydrolase 3 domain-containing protein n=1 Tax=Leptospira brenneri TaxID=2023182 RepID=A0A2M9XZZ3_9LEPT|nr:MULTISPECIES: amidohydrolase family protein [Leptospira]PJZ44894.1 hypothetical protein CH361_11595 [Leptospira brenneri]PJZ79284.1 hypothetical protein CH359_18545 [Leptospira meyeri]PJZ95168.1 hypothetical protein CH358_18800 [Leptospira meyeri]TGK95307.1 hypothetical protein EHQ30_01295 [Leptospira brenneri]